MKDYISIRAALSEKTTDEIDVEVYATLPKKEQRARYYSDTAAMTKDEKINHAAHILYNVMIAKNRSEVKTTQFIEPQPLQCPIQDIVEDSPIPLPPYAHITKPTTKPDSPFQLKTIVMQQASLPPYEPDPFPHPDNRYAVYEDIPIDMVFPAPVKKEKKQ